MKDVITVATRNKGKVKELRELLGEQWEVRSLFDLDASIEIPEVEETGETFLENARLKAEVISRIVDGWILADDSGLEVDALDGKPGVLSARYAGVAGEGATCANNAKLLRELERAGAREDHLRSARFRCVLVLARDGKHVADFDGVCEGKIITTSRGDGGFGYDPLFVPEGQSATFAQLGSDVKNDISHRGRAFARFAGWTATLTSLE